MSKVNSHTEWGKLKEVIVGSPVNFAQSELELSFKIFYHDNAEMAFAYPSYEIDKENNSQQRKDRFKRYVEELSEDVDSLVNALENAGVKVHRPTHLKKLNTVKTPYWEATCIPALNVRDQVIILGNEIIETAPQIRARYFENDLLKGIFYKYFQEGSKWTSMPRPMMTDNSFDLSYIQEVGREMIATQMVSGQKTTEFDVGHEILFDGAQCIKFGRDILVNVSTKNHEMGLQWLQTHLGDTFRFHRWYRVSDSHIDSIILPLRPGKLLLRSPEFFDMLPDPLKKWDIIYAPKPTTAIFPSYEEDDLILTSQYIDLNVLSISPDTVIANSLFPELIKTLEKSGFNVIPVQHRHRRLFGGGFHCFTLDTVREDSLEDYFS